MSIVNSWWALEFKKSVTIIFIYFLGYISVSLEKIDVVNERMEADPSLTKYIKKEKDIQARILNSFQVNKEFRIPLTPMGVVAHSLRTLDHSPVPPSAWPEIVRAVVCKVAFKHLP